MTIEEKKNALHCLKVMLGEEVCEECDLYGTTGTDHCEADCVRVAIKALEQDPCSDAISRQAVLDIAKSSKSNWIDNSVLFKRVNELPSVNPQEPKTGWIPVSERLPEAGEYVGDVAKYYLVQNEYGDMLVARYTHSEYWEQMYQIKPYSAKIVAWMPLPEPYKAD